jgi:hypothetical protein
VDELFWVCGGLLIWVLGGDDVFWMSCFGFVLRVCSFGDGGGSGGGGGGSFGFGFGLCGWKNGFGVGGLWCFGGGSGWSVVAGVDVLMLVNWSVEKKYIKKELFYNILI